MSSIWTKVSHSLQWNTNHYLSKIRHKDFHPLSFVRSSLSRYPPPPEIWNGLDWRALVKSRPPNIGKLRGKHFFLQQFFFFLIFLCDFLRFFEIRPSVPKMGTDGQTYPSVLKLGTDIQLPRLLLDTKNGLKWAKTAW